MSSNVRGPVVDGQYGPNITRACAIDNAPEMMHCDALHNLSPFDANGSYGPADIQSAYNLPSSTNGTGQTVAIVDAYGYPTAESDLGLYRSHYGLSACTTKNGCLKIVNQMGKPSHYPANSGWDAEQALDIDMVSATCPNCHILLVQSKTNSFKNLAAAVNQAVKQGAHIVSNSYSGECTAKSEMKCLFSKYTFSGVTVLAAAGDEGYWGPPPANVVPAGLSSVISVGGTTLVHASGPRPWSETVWGGSGSGCTSFTKPSWQADTGCTGRTGNDVAAIGNPSTGVVIYINGHTAVYGGTSVATPLLAGVYGLAGNANSLNGGQSLYQHTSNLFDVTSGSNGSCSPAYLCTGEVGYDGPTGNGTPNGVGAF